MKILISTFITVIIVAFISSCYYDKEDLLYGGANNLGCADTTGSISYAQKIVPVLQQYCYSCHTGSFPSGGILMGTYTADKTIAQNGKLYGTINYSSGYSPMPKGTPKLSSCQIIMIKKWIDSGMLNN